MSSLRLYRQQSHAGSCKIVEQNWPPQRAAPHVYGYVAPRAKVTDLGTKSALHDAVWTRFAGGAVCCAGENDYPAAQGSRNVSRIPPDRALSLTRHPTPGGRRCPTIRCSRAPGRVAGGSIRHTLCRPTSLRGPIDSSRASADNRARSTSSPQRSRCSARPRPLPAIAAQQRWGEGFDVTGGFRRSAPLGRGQQYECPSPRGLRGAQPSQPILLAQVRDLSAYHCEAR